MIRKLMQEREEGFTLIELLVVVIIIGILAAIAIPAFLNQRESAWQSELASTLRNVAIDVESAATQANGDYSTVDQAAVNGFLTDLQGAAADPVAIAFTAAADGNSFCMTGQHTSLGTGAGEPNMAYNSAGGGLGPFQADGSATCP